MEANQVTFDIMTETRKHNPYVKAFEKVQQHELQAYEKG